MRGYEDRERDRVNGVWLVQQSRAIPWLDIVLLRGDRASYLLLAPLVRGPFGPELSRTLISWGIAIFSLVAWWTAYSRESRERSRGRVPPFSGNTPRLAIVLLLFGAIPGSALAVVPR